MTLLARASDDAFADLAEATVAQGESAPLIPLTLRFLVNDRYATREQFADEIAESLDWLIPPNHNGIYEIVWEDPD